MGLNTIRDHVDNNFKENPDYNFITCPYTKKRITNKNLKRIFSKLQNCSFIDQDYLLLSNIVGRCS